MILSAGSELSELPDRIRRKLDKNDDGYNLNVCFYFIPLHFSYIFFSLLLHILIHVIVCRYAVNCEALRIPGVIERENDFFEITPK